mgnify:CR=1 FL=1|jgi:hypothetical protein
MRRKRLDYFDHFDGADSWDPEDNSSNPPPAVKLTARQRYLRDIGEDWQDDYPVGSREIRETLEREPK